MDPSFLLAATTDANAGPPAWITTAAYLWLAMLCAWAWRRRREEAGWFDSASWIVLACMFGALGIAKPFGMQWMLVKGARRQAIEGDWYEVRRRFQAQIILAVLATATAAMIVVVGYALRRRRFRALAAYAPVMALLAFIAVRAISLHQVDALLYRSVGVLDVNTLIEWSLLSLVVAGLSWRASGAHESAPDVAIVSDGDARAQRSRVQ